MCGTLAVRLSAEATPVQVLGEAARKLQNNRRARQSYRRQSESCHRFIAEMVLRCPPFIWRCAPPVPRQSDSSAKRTPLRWRRQSSSPLRSGLAVEVWWLRMQSRLICCQPRIHQEARGPRVSPSPSPPRGLVESQSRSTLNNGIAMLHASRTTKSGGIVVCCWLKRPGVRVLVLTASELLPWAGSQTGGPPWHSRDVDGGRSSRVQVLRSVRSPAAPEGR